MLLYLLSQKSRCQDLFLCQFSPSLTDLLRTNNHKSIISPSLGNQPVIPPASPHPSHSKPTTCAFTNDRPRLYQPSFHTNIRIISPLFRPSKTPDVGRTPSAATNVQSSISQTEQSQQANLLPRKSPAISMSHCVIARWSCMNIFLVFAMYFSVSVQKLSLLFSP